MPESSRKDRVLNIVLLTIAVACLIATAIQYPLSTTFPIGGDAAAIISRVQHIFTNPINTFENIRHSWYPVSYILFSLNALNPFVYWPVAFSWWMAIGQILTGIALGLLAYRISGIRAAALAMAIWALTPITMTSFFEDGTMAQLWSLPWVLLFFERMLAKSLRGMIISCILLFFSHPVTAVIFLASTFVALPHILFTAKKSSSIEKRIRYIILWCSLGCIAAGLFFFATKPGIFNLAFTPESSKYSPELFHGFFLPWLLASIIGYLHMTIMHKKEWLFLVTLGSFLVVSFLFAINDQLGIGFWVNRLNAYLIICICLGGGVGFSYLLGQLRSPVLSTLIAVFLLTGITGSVFHDNQNIYRRYESPSTYSRIHPDELAAISWAKEHIQPPSIILSSGLTRHYEWIPVLSRSSWQALKERDLFSVERYKTFEHPYLIFFTKKEKVPSWISEGSNTYHEIFRNNGAVIYRISL
jgi:hypothetical protein